jgi:hypothetical protein
MFFITVKTYSIKILIGWLLQGAVKSPVLYSERYDLICYEVNRFGSTGNCLRY